LFPRYKTNSPYTTAFLSAKKVVAKSDDIWIIQGGQVILEAGTSAASPIFASIVGMIATQLPSGQAGFGWVSHSMIIIFIVM